MIEDLRFSAYETEAHFGRLVEANFLAICPRCVCGCMGKIEVKVFVRKAYGTDMDIHFLDYPFPRSLNHEMTLPWTCPECGIDFRLRPRDWEKLEGETRTFLIAEEIAAKAF